MTAPSISVRRQDGQTGVVRPSGTGVLAIIAGAVAGTVNVASQWLDVRSMVSTYTAGTLVENASYTMGVSGKPVLGIPCTCTTAGTCGTVYSLANGGTSVVTATGAPIDEYNLLFTIVNGGTRGTAGITYTFSLDGGLTTSGVTALGTATSVAFNLPNSTTSTGVTLNFAAGTLATGAQYQVYTTRPQPNSSDIAAALEGLRISKQPWDAVYVDVDATPAMLSLLDAWLTSLENVGQFNEGALNIRHKLQPVSWVPNELAFASVQAAPIETETVYLASSAVTGFATVASIRCIVGADAADVVSQLTGLTQPRAAALVIMAEAMGIPVGQDPAFGGPTTNADLADQFGNPKWHDEFLYPGFDSLRFSTMESRPGEQGAFITNANLFSSSGSDYVYLQHARVMNSALTTAAQLLRKELSKGVGKTAPDPVTGAIYISEASASAIESFVNAELASQLKGQVVGALVVLSRTDDLSSNAGATIHADVDVEALAYIKNFAITAKFVRTIPVTA